ncbi:hypothetical protein ACFLR1_07260 [Bacteroidota bacterium]
MRVLPIIVIAIAGLLTSCGQREKELEEQVTQLSELSSQKDTDIEAFITSMSNIQSNLDSIKKLEEIVTARVISNTETDKSAEENIVDDMMLIYSNMKKTQDQLAALEKQLNESSIASEKLMRFVAKLKQDIVTKDEEIQLLKQGLAEANIYIDDLMSSVDRLALENERRVKIIQQKNTELRQKEDEIMTAYWVAGTVKDLRARNIIDKEGAFLGMGGVVVVSEDMDLRELQKINIKDVVEIQLNTKKASLVTSHPKHTYEFAGEKRNIEKLVIDDSEGFWQNSKVLVIITN